MIIIIDKIRMNIEKLPVEIPKAIPGFSINVNLIKSPNIWIES